MIQDIAPSVYDNQFQFKKHEPTDILMAIKGKNMVGRRTEDSVEYVRFEEIPGYGETVVPEELEKKIIYLYAMDGVSYYGADPQLDTHEEVWNLLLTVPGVTEFPVSDTREIRPMAQAFAGITAKQLNEWYRARKFCGRCGAKMEKSTTERAMVCPECKLLEYPKICPAVIIALVDGEKIMMTKYAGRGFTRYALIAGFTEIGEPLEDTVKREAMEEVGLKVKDITYYKSQPWSYSDTLLAGFYCKLDGEGQSIKMDANELAVAEWIDRKDMEPRGGDISLTSEMMEMFRLRQDPFSLGR